MATDYRSSDQFYFPDFWQDCSVHVFKRLLPIVQEENRFSRIVPSVDIYLDLAKCADHLRGKSFSGLSRFWREAKGLHSEADRNLAYIIEQIVYRNVTNLANIHADKEESTTYIERKEKPNKIDGWPQPINPETLKDKFVYAGLITGFRRRRSMISQLADHLNSRIAESIVDYALQFLNENLEHRRQYMLVPCNGLLMGLHFNQDHKITFTLSPGLTSLQRLLRTLSNLTFSKDKTPDPLAPTR